MMRPFLASSSRHQKKAARLLSFTRRRSIWIGILILLLISLSAPTNAESTVPPIATTPDKFAAVLVHCYRSRRRPVPAEPPSATYPESTSSTSSGANAAAPPPHTPASAEEEVWIERDTGFAFLDEEGQLSTNAVSSICGGDEHTQVGLVSPAAASLQSNSDGSPMNEWSKSLDKDGTTAASPRIVRVLNTTHVPLENIKRSSQQVEAVQSRTEEYFSSFRTFMSTLFSTDETLLPLDPLIEYEAHVTMLPQGWTMSAPFTPPESYHPWALCNKCGEDVSWQQSISGVRWKCNNVKGRCRGREFCDFHYRQHLADLAAENKTEPLPYYSFHRPALSSRLLWAPTAIEVVLNAVDNFGDVPYLGEIGFGVETKAEAPEYAPDGRLPTDEFPEQYHPVDRLKQYVWTTYRELKAEFMAVGASLRRLIPKGSFVGLYAPNSREWAAVDFACLSRNLTTVGLHARWTAPTILRIVNQTKMKAILIKGNHQLETIINVAQQHQLSNEAEGNSWPLKYILLAHSLPRDGPRSQAELDELATLTTQATSFGMVVIDYSSFVSLSSTPSALVALSQESLPYSAEDELVSLIYTSGSTDAPKGCMYTQNMARYELAPGRAAMGMMNSLVLEAFPFAWATGHAILRSTFVHGCSLALYNGHPANLIAEYQRVAPTKIMSVPAVWNQLFSMYKNFVVRREKESEKQGEIDKRAVVDPNLSLPRAVSPNSPDRRRAFHDDAAFPYISEFRQTYPVGPRMKHASIGSAMSTPELRQFLRALFGSDRVVEGYGTTEAGGLMADGVVLYAERRLVDVPELGYFSTDKPYPRGELLVRTPHTIPGYYMDPEATAAKFTEDGFFRTGDVVEQRSDTEFHLVDRVSNFFKLSNGEFLSPEWLQSVYMRSPLVHQVFVHGESQRSGVVAIVVPNIPALQAAFDKIGKDSATGSESSVYVDVSTLLHSPVMASLIRADIARECHAASLASAMFPLAVHITPEEFTAANGLLTVSSKPARTAVRNRFQAEINHMYATFEETRSELGDHPTTPNTIETVAVDSASTTTSPLVSILSRILAVSEQLLHESVDVSTLGLTSLSATQIVNTVQKELGANLPMHVLLDTNSPVTLESLTKMVSESKGKEMDQQEDVQDIKASDQERLVQQLQADILLPLELSTEVTTQALPLRELYVRHVLQRATSPIVLNSTRHVLLTGVTGFLGGQLLSELLSNPETIVHCLIRPSVQTDHSRAQSQVHLEVARQRLIESLKSRDLWQEDLMGRVLVYSGSVETPSFGLPSEVYGALLENVSQVYHSAANVNWILPYSALRQTNVIGTQRILQFVSAARSLQQEDVKLVHVSTASVRADIFHDHTLVETKEITPTVITSLSSAVARHDSGYALSKWVSEILVKRAALSAEAPSAALNEPRFFMSEMPFPHIAAAMREHAHISSPGFIGPHSVSGDCGQYDFLSRYIDTVLTLGVYVNSRQEFVFTPVEQVAQDITLAATALGRSREEELRAPPQPQSEPIAMSYHQIGAAIRRAVDATVTLASARSEPQPVSSLDFLSLVRARPDVGLFPLLSVISQPGFFGLSQQQQQQCDSINDDMCTAALPEEHSNSFGLQQCVRRRMRQLARKKN